MKHMDLSGQRFGRLIALSRSENNGRRATWNCLCDCGKTKLVLQQSLTGNATKSCGCWLSQATKQRFIKHGESRGAEYSSWYGATRRCTEPTTEGFSEYGGRGITMCGRWLNSFEFFLQDMGRRPSLKHSLDRIDNDGHYEPGNCRWATKKEQGRNTRVNRMICVNGETMCASDWADRRQIPVGYILKRLSLGWSETDAVMREAVKRQARSSHH